VTSQKTALSQSMVPSKVTTLSQKMVKTILNLRASSNRTRRTKSKPSDLFCW
jgi:hypothetical protein